MSRTTRQLLTLGFFGLSLAVSPLAGQASAQATGDRAGSATATTPGVTSTAPMATDNMGSTTRVTRDEGFNPSWLGLLGLAGLAGLMPKKVQHVNTVTTHRPTDTTTR